MYVCNVESMYFILYIYVYFVYHGIHMIKLVQYMVKLRSETLCAFPRFQNAIVIQWRVKI